MAVEINCTEISGVTGRGENALFVTTVNVSGLSGEESSCSCSERGAAGSVRLKRCTLRNEPATDLGG